jgi:hypothetical protein
MAGVPSYAEAQQAYAAYQQYDALDKQYDLTSKAAQGGEGVMEGRGNFFWFFCLA